MGKGKIWSVIFGGMLIITLGAACTTQPAASTTGPTPTAVPLVSAITPTSPLTVTPTPSPTVTPTPSLTITPEAATPTDTLTPDPPTPTPKPAAPPLGVILIQDGDVKFWREERQQTELIWAIGDAHAIWSSPDGETAVVLRSQVDFETDPMFGCKYSSLWVIDLDGPNPRELVPFDALRDYLDEQPCPYLRILIYQLMWLPKTNQVIFSLIRDDSHLPPEGIFLVDLETGASQILAPAASHSRFVPSPNGRQLALISHTGLSFVTVDGRDWREDVITYPSFGVPTPILPTGLWTEASDAFLLVTAEENESPFIFNVAIWRVPLDEGEIQRVAYLTNACPQSVTFAPDGQLIAYGVDPGGPYPIQEWSVAPLSPGLGALAIPRQIQYPANLHWSPAGKAFHFPNGFRNIFSRICVGDHDPAEECDAALDLGDDRISYLQWLDDGRFLFLTWSRALYLGSFLDGDVTPVVVGHGEEWSGVNHFAVIVPMR